MAERPRLSIVRSPEEIWAGRVAGLDLPGELHDQRVQWRPWKPQIRLLCGGFDQSCDECRAAVTDQAHATGLAPAPWGKPGVPMVRYGADACLMCRHVVVLELFHGDRFGVDLDPAEVWSNRGQQVLL